jgi:primosomal protein N' (replication factor Y) (superfamily II helicase)
MIQKGPPVFAEVLLEVSIRKPLDYVIPPELIPSVIPGVWVEVPLRQRTSRGYVVTVKQSSEIASPLPISAVLSDGPVITEDLFRLGLWMASYYATPIERVLKTMLPSGVRKSIGVKRQYLISRAKTRDELVSLLEGLRKTAPAQAKVVEILLQTKGGIFLSELAEQASCTPAVIKSLNDKGLVRFDYVRSDQPLLHGETYFRTTSKKLLPEQQKALNAILASLSSGSFSVKLLFGVTGSGKTEVYMQAIDAALKLGKGVLMLVPEIALTAQTIQRFQSRFDAPLAILHHRLSDGERNEAWNEIRKGQRRIVIGARSAIFSPIPNLGLILIDEEHEHSYKQTDDSPTYHARDVGVMRGKLTNATVVLGSATPALESFHNASIQKYDLLTLSGRPEDAILPKVHIVDMRKEYDAAKGITFFSELLLDKIQQRTAKGEQTMLFLNRRGYHTTLTCMQCRSVIKCSHCDGAMTFHKSNRVLTCHLCGLQIPPPDICPVCRTPSMIKYQGVGTEKIESMLRGIFPGTRVIRADADSTRHKGALEKILHDFRTGKADVMVGTQMIAKGLHFPEVTLVGVLSCDASLNIPDFRAQESVFQLITQVAGRAGRGLAQGEVVLQTALPDHPTIIAASRQDYLSFFTDEMGIRKTFQFPPYTHIIKFVFHGSDEKAVAGAATSWGENLQKHLSSAFICHPALPCGHAKINDRWRYQCLVRGPSVLAVTALAEQLDRTFKLPSGVQRFCDVDPSSTFF